MFTCTSGWLSEHLSSLNWVELILFPAGHVVTLKHKFHYSSATGGGKDKQNNGTYNG